MKRKFARRRRLIPRVILAVRAHPFPVVAAVFVLIQLCRDMLVLVARDHHLVAHTAVVPINILCPFLQLSSGLVVSACTCRGGIHPHSL